jgi:Protein of unknown function (DUF3892)
MYLSAKKTGSLRVTYSADDGSRTTYVGGTRTWRNNNPGDLGAGPFTRRHGAIGKAGSFAVFPSVEIGRDAIFSLLKNEDYQSRTIWDAIPKYSPSTENDVSRYRKLIGQFTGLDMKRKLQDLTAQEFALLINGIERVEGWKVGKIIKEPKKNKITAIRRNKKGTIIQYYVEGIGWISKEAAIRLVTAGKVDAVIVYSSNGTPYIRTRPDKTTTNNLGAMGR